LPLIVAEPISEHNDLKWLHGGGHLTFGVPGAALMSLCDGFLLSGGKRHCERWL